jgi:hypothetical protein
VTTRIRAQLALLGSSVRGDVFELADSGDESGLCMLDWPRAKS